MSKNWTHVSFVVIACLIVGGSMWAEEEGAKKKAGQGKRAAQAEKAAKMAKEQFQKRDKDSDGKLSLEEFKGGRRKAQNAEALFKILDQNEDGSVCIEEFTKKPVEFRFASADKDGDGKLTFDEFKGPRKGDDAIERAEQQFKRMDADGDKIVTLDEMKAAQKKPGAGKKKGKGKGKAGKKKTNS